MLATPLDAFVPKNFFKDHGGDVLLLGAGGSAINSNYEGSEVITDEDGTRRGYKLSTLRGLTGDTGVLEEVKMGSIKQHDLELSRDMIRNSKMLKPGDITDLKKTAKQIISTYELRPEIEEDYRQIKDFWQIEDFKSTKHNFIAFHVVMVLIGYLFFQLYKCMVEGQKYAGKTLPVAVKKYVEAGPLRIEDQ